MDNILVNDTINSLKYIADILYKGDCILGQAKLGEVIPNLAQLSECMEDDGLKNRWANDALMPLLEAMQDMDATGMADIITYEVIQILETLA